MNEANAAVRAEKNRPHGAKHSRRRMLYRQALLYGILFLAVAALVAVLWVFTDVIVASVFTCLGALFTAAEVLSLFRAFLSAARLAAVRGSDEYDKAVVRKDGCALFFDADAERFLAYADALLRAEYAEGKEKRRMRAEVDRARDRLGKPLRIRRFTAADAARLHGKTLYLSGLYYAESGGTPPAKPNDAATERHAAWLRAAERNLLVVQGRQGS